MTLTLTFVITSWAIQCLNWMCWVFWLWWVTKHRECGNLVTDTLNLYWQITRRRHQSYKEKTSIRQAIRLRNLFPWDSLISGSNFTHSWLGVNTLQFRLFLQSEISMKFYYFTTIFKHWFGNILSFYPQTFVKLLSGAILGKLMAWIVDKKAWLILCKHHMIHVYSMKCWKISMHNTDEDWFFTVKYKLLNSNIEREYFCPINVVLHGYTTNSVFTLVHLHVCYVIG